MGEKIERTADQIQHVEIPGELNRLSPSVPAVGIFRQLPAKQIVAIARQYGIRHMVNAAEPFADLEKKTAKIMLTNLDLFLDYPIASILRPDEVRAMTEKELGVFNKSYNRIDQKPAAIQGIVDIARSWRKSEAFISEAGLAADELFTNAIFNAPYVSFGEDKRVARTKENGNNPKIKPFRLFMGKDKDRIVIGCEDKYGTLHPDKLLERIRGCLEHERDATLEWISGIGGLGTYMIFRSALSYYAGVSVGQRTVVCCAFPLQTQKLEFVQNIHLSFKDK